MLSRKRVLLWQAAVVMALVLTASISISCLTQKHKDISTDELAKACKTKNGTWLESYRECEYVDPEWCSAKGGQFDECASACRHNAHPATPCTMQCVPLCIFGSRGTKSDKKAKLLKN